MTTNSLSEHPKQIRIAILGNVDSGKSTTLGVLTHAGLYKDLNGTTGILDDGQGLARSRIFRHPHEKETGRTSSVSHHYLENYKNDTIITFIDLAGHEKYLKTTMFGLNGCSADYAILMVGANNGLVGTAKEHIQLALSLNIPLIVCVTKIDFAPKHVWEATMTDIENTLKSKENGRRVAFKVKDESDIDEITKSISDPTSKMSPIFEISNVSGQGIDLFRNFLSQLQPTINWEMKKDSEKIFCIQEKYNIKGIGLVVYGLLKSGTIKVGDRLHLGPFDDKFKLVEIKSIHNYNKQSIEYLHAGENGCFNIKSTNSKEIIRRYQINKGMVILENPHTTQYFWARVKIIKNPTSISIGYQPTIHSSTVYQCAEIIQIDKLDKEVLISSHKEGKLEEVILDSTLKNKDLIIRSGDIANILFKFIFESVYITTGSIISFREGKTKGLGKIIKLLDTKTPCKRK